MSSYFFIGFFFIFLFSRQTHLSWDWPAQTLVLLKCNIVTICYIEIGCKCMALPPTCGCRHVVLPLTCSFKLIFWFHQQIFHTNDDYRNSMKEVFRNHSYSFIDKVSCIVMFGTNILKLICLMLKIELDTFSPDGRFLFMVLYSTMHIVWIGSFYCPE